MKIEDLKINQLLDIEIENSDLTIEKFPSRIEEIRKPYLYVSMPMKHGVLVPLRLGQEVQIVVAGKSGFFGARTRIVGRNREPVPILVVDLPGELISLPQRREYVRLEIALPVEFRLSNQKAGEKAIFGQGITSDISGGGLFFVSRLSLELGQSINLRLFLTEKDIIECEGIIVRSLQDNDNHRMYGSGVKYVDIGEKQIDKIFSYIFSKQREWIQKGLL